MILVIAGEPRHQWHGRCLQMPPPVARRFGVSRRRGKSSGKILQNAPVQWGKPMDSSIKWMEVGRVEFPRLQLSRSIWIVEKGKICRKTRSCLVVIMVSGSDIPLNQTNGRITICKTMWI